MAKYRIFQNSYVNNTRTADIRKLYDKYFNKSSGIYGSDPLIYPFKCIVYQYIDYWWPVIKLLYVYYKDYFRDIRFAYEDLDFEIPPKYDYNFICFIRRLYSFMTNIRTNYKDIVWTHALWELDLIFDDYWYLCKDIRFKLNKKYSHNYSLIWKN